MKKAMIGYQIYSAREDAEKDLFGTLKKIAEMGYDGVEFAGFYHYTVDEIKKALEESGLVAISAHVPLVRWWAPPRTGDWPANSWRTAACRRWSVRIPRGRRQC